MHRLPDGLDFYYQGSPMPVDDDTEAALSYLHSIKRMWKWIKIDDDDEFSFTNYEMTQNALYDHFSMALTGEIVRE